MDLPELPDPRFSTIQTKAWKAMRSLLLHPKKSDRSYDSIVESAGGRIISTDLARFLDDRYAKAPQPGRQRDIKPGWDLAWRYAQDRLVRELKTRGNRMVVRLMAGGWAAGKTHALEKRSLPDLAWDGTLCNTKWSAEMIDLALVSGWKVEVAYVFRDLELAFYGAVERSLTEGRMVPLEDLPGTHRAVQQSILVLTALYATDPRVSFLLLHNLGTESVHCEPLKLSRDDLASSGGLHYSHAYECYYVQAARHIGKAPHS